MSGFSETTRPGGSNGVLLVGITYALRPERRFVPLLISLGVVTLSSGFLSFSMGVVNTLRYVAKIPAAEQHTTTLIGLAESSHNLVLALVTLTLATLACAVGALRLARSPVSPALS